LELAEKIDAKRLTLAARSAPLPWAQRLGYLLELVGAKEQARALKDYVHRHARIGPRWFPAPAARAMALETDKVKSTRLAQDVFQHPRLSLKNMADPGVRGLLNCVEQLVAFDGHIEVWAHGLCFANAFSQLHVQLRNVEGFGRLRAAHSELGAINSETSM
jgi:hypothetical protein